jgi:hypothetical protein
VKRLSVKTSYEQDVIEANRRNIRHKDVDSTKLSQGRSQSWVLRKAKSELSGSIKSVIFLRPNKYQYTALMVY